jgi:hypothetical protein
MIALYLPQLALAISLTTCLEFEVMTKFCIIRSSARANPSRQTIASSVATSAAPRSTKAELLMKLPPLSRHTTAAAPLARVLEIAASRCILANAGGGAFGLIAFVGATGSLLYFADRISNSAIK